MSEKRIEEVAELLHIWYLEAIKELDPNSYNKEARKPYDKLTEGQKYIDRYIAKKILGQIPDMTIIPEPLYDICPKFDFHATYCLQRKCIEKQCKDVKLWKK